MQMKKKLNLDGFNTVHNVNKSHANKQLRVQAWRVCQSNTGLCGTRDHFHKWRPIRISFASIKISLTDLILKLIIQKKFYSETRLVRLI